MKALKFVLQNACNLISLILLIGWTRQALVAREQIIMGKGKILTYYISCKINNMRSLKKHLFYVIFRLLNIFHRLELIMSEF